MTLAQQQAKSENAAQRDYAAICKRTNDPHPGDDAKLLEARNLLGISVEDFDSDVAAVASLAELREKASGAEDVRKIAKELSRRHEAKKQEIEDTAKRLEDERSALWIKVLTAQHLARRALSVKDSIQQVPTPTAPTKTPMPPFVPLPFSTVKATFGRRRRRAAGFHSNETRSAVRSVLSSSVDVSWICRPLVTSRGLMHAFVSSTCF